ncbi:TOBE domain-containing protein [Novosphingobium album (ex Liu et al. 2023)]|uniref:TOBE domain-containing protein n=1 Tax=Novosphingobium album (ex Liu et al. 2023) TaxID=3031130 RepID=A0ABT5WQU8_9SPHN|nr:TOBE domain-containing protein [Novosphingobium album (ex Liu et al. 2023)]MDE8652229.1 TOBE domain-containing protein [Novosphingobium album (ex Liu et al. 2023)]
MASIARLPAERVRSLRSCERNMLDGIVTAIVHGPINAEVGLLVNDRIVIDALVTNANVIALDIRPGGRAVALIKASFVTLVEDVPGLRLSARNLIGGTVIALSEGPVETEAVLDIGGGRELAAIVTSHSAREMMLAPGRSILACFKASHIILAAED